MLRLITISFLFVSLFSFTYPNISIEKGKKTIISGKITNTTNPGKSLMIRDAGLPFNFDPNHPTDIDEAGNFTLELEINKPQYYEIQYKRRVMQLFISPGDELQITFEANNMNYSIEYAGTGSEMNTFLKDRVLQDLGLIGRKNALYKMEWEEYEENINKHKEKRQKALDQFLDGKKVKGNLAVFAALEQAQIDGLWGTFYMQYPSHSAHYAKKNAKEQWPKLDLDKATKLLSKEIIALESKTYRDFLNQYVFSMSDKYYNEKGVPFISRGDFANKVYQYSSKIIDQGWQLDYLKARIIYEQVNKFGLADMEQPVDDFRKTVDKKNKNYYKAVDDVWNKWASVKPGVDAPDIIGKDINGNEIKLSDYRGKLVYIDVWATWCGPCRAEIPHLKKAEELFHGKDVVFMSVSIDNDKGRWKSMVEKDELGGVQIHNVGGWGADICKKYNISSIPRFMLIGKDGKIIDVNVARPSHGVAGLIQKKLQEK